VAERDNAAISFKLPELRAGVNALALGPIATPQLEAFFFARNGDSNSTNDTITTRGGSMMMQAGRRTRVRDDMLAN
jgi:hypothetical protein